MLSVLISTRNGQNTLPAMLNSLCAQTLPQSEWKLVVVDNGSTDETAMLLESYRERLPITILNEPSPGKNRALNRARTEAAGDLVVFSDDDVMCPENWLSGYRQAADKNPNFAIFGGPIHPHWPRPPDDWILACVPLGTVFSITDGDVSDGDCSIGRIWGANFAVRREIFDCFGRFPENIGPNGTQYAMGSESAVLYRMANAGHKAFFVNGTAVLHIIRSNQLERTWILGRAKRFGRGQCRLGFIENGPITELFGTPRWILPNLVKAFLRGLFAINMKKKFIAEWDQSYALGYIEEYRLCRTELMI